MRTEYEYNRNDHVPLLGRGKFGGWDESLQLRWTEERAKCIPEGSVNG